MRRMERMSSNLSVINVINLVIKLLSVLLNVRKQEQSNRAIVMFIDIMTRLTPFNLTKM